MNKIDRLLYELKDSSDDNEEEYSELSDSYDELLYKTDIHP